MMTTARVETEVALLLELIDQAYDKKAWHGPNLKGSIRGLSVAEATWRSKPDRHSIAEIVVHAAYWKYAARRRLRGDKRGSFALSGSNWFPIGSNLSHEDWRGFAVLLDREHKTLRSAIATLTASELHATPPGSKVTRAALIEGVALHDVYHAGQIQLLKRLQGAAEDRKRRPQAS